LDERNVEPNPRLGNLLRPRANHRHAEQQKSQSKRPPAASLQVTQRLVINRRRRNGPFLFDAELRSASSAGILAGSSAQLRTVCAELRSESLAFFNRKFTRFKTRSRKSSIYKRINLVQRGNQRDDQ